MLAYLAFTLGLYFVYQQAYTTLPLAMRMHGLSPQEYGFAMAVNGILIVALQPWVRGWLGKHDHCIVLAAGFVVVGLGFGADRPGELRAGLRRDGRRVDARRDHHGGLGRRDRGRPRPAVDAGRYSGAYGAVSSVALLLGRSAGPGCSRSARRRSGSPAASSGRPPPPGCSRWRPPSGAVRAPRGCPERAETGPIVSCDLNCPH